MKKFILIVVILVIVWTIWYLVGHVLLGENVFDSYGLIIISGVIAGFLAAPFEMHKKDKE